MSEFDTEAPVPAEAPGEDEVLSDETGTIYDDVTGAAETTPHDLEDDDEDEE